MQENKYVYFDHAASTSLHEDVIELLNNSFSLDFANPAAKHKLGKTLSKRISDARESILQSLHATKSDQYSVIFPSSATEANNQVIKTFLNDYPDKEIIHYLSDHPSVSNCLKTGVKSLNVDQDIIQEVNEKTSLVILTHVNSQTGVITDFDSICTKIKKKYPQVRVMVDSAQGLGKVPVNLHNSKIDYFIFAGHKLGAPRGIAGLIFKQNAPLTPLLNGGPHELNFRASTPATSLILALAKAVEISTTEQEKTIAAKKKLSEKLKKELQQIHPNIVFPWENQDCSPYINTLIFKGIASDILMRHLEEKSIFVSSSTACSSKVKVQNKMMDGLLIDKQLQKSVLRISFGYGTTQEELDYLIENFKEIVESISFLIK